MEDKRMIDTGVVRKLDDLGRITLPMELRKNLGITDRDPLHIYVEDQRIILEKYAPSDIFTGNREDLIEFHGKRVSKESIKEMAKLAGLKIAK
jgi:AbrB family transcriptional regulator, transcriptional pleiotropic regulator of transition state genes